MRYATAWIQIAYGLLGVCSKFAWCLLEAFSKTHLDFLNINEGFFRKPTSPPLPLREGPPLISVFSPQGRRGNRSSSSLVTISFYGWRTIRGLRQQRSCGLRPHGYKSLTGCLVLARSLLGACSKFFRIPTWISLVLMTEVLPHTP